jgi:hypothetical protein
MSGEIFNGFGQFARPDIGLISDGFQNLAEIFESDKRDALRNILLAPESLDQISGLSSVISQEDLRATSGLSSFFLSTLHQIDNISRDRILESLEVEKLYFSPRYPLGGNSSNTLDTPNVVLFNGSIKCHGAFYRANVIGESLFSTPEKRLIALSTSRASLFNSELDEENLGFFKNVSYPGTIRVRRKSHLNRIFVPESSFVKKTDVPEAPSHTIKVNVANGSTGQVTPVKLLATKNSPLRVYCRLAKGKIKFTFTDTSAPYFFGYQIQPVQQRPNTEQVEFLPVQSVAQESGSTTFTLDLDITRTGYQTVYDLYLYLYLNPEKIKGIEFEGIDIRESPDGRDLGLIGFNNLEVLKVSGGSMTILPLWLKTLSNKLRVLDLADSGDTWKSGPMGWFDIRNPSATPSLSHPLYTAVGYLTIPKAGPMINETGDDWADEKFEKYILGESRTPGVDYRQFDKLTELRLGNRFRGLNPNLQDVFPNLRIVEWRARDGESGTFLSGTKLPSIKNTGSLTEYNISGSGVSGTIYDIGTSTDPANDGYISKYKMVSFNISGRLSARHNITGFIGNPVGEDWSAWYLNCVFINASDTSALIDLQVNEWKSLRELYFTRSLGGFNFSNPSTPLKTPSLRILEASGARINGQIPSLGVSSSLNTGELNRIELYGARDIQAVVKNGVSYFLPENFAPSRASGSPHKLVRFVLAFVGQSFRFRERDLINLRELAQFPIFNSGFTGRFPIFPVRENPEQNRKVISISCQFCSFHDLTNLSINNSNPYYSRDIAYLDISNQNLGAGGCILPGFEGASNADIQTVIADNSLRSTYPDNWLVTNLRRSVVRNSDPQSEVSGLSIQRTIQTPGEAWVESDNIFILTGGTNLNGRVLVNDLVRLDANGPEVARVISLTPTQIVIDRNIPGTLPGTLYFSRNTHNISDWFSLGFSRTVTFRARNCRLSGTLNIRTTLPLTTFLDLSENCLSGYVSGSLSRVFVGNTRNITVTLASNNLPLESVRNIISEVVTIDSARRFRNCTVRVGFNKLDVNGKYVNYSQNEIFPTEIRKGSDVVTSLFRQEEFYVYESVVSFNEEGEQVINRTIVGTQFISIPGALVEGVYYKTRVNETQVTVESQLAVSFKNLSGVRVDLGFNYTTPTSTPVTTNTLFTNPTTRYQSIIEAGYNTQDLVNP